MCAISKRLDNYVLMQCNHVESMLAAIIHWDGTNNNEELYFDTDTYNVVIC